MPRWLDTSDPLGALLLGAALIAIGLGLSWAMRRLIGAVLRLDKAERIDQITLTFLSRLAVLAMWVVLVTLYAHLVPALNRLGTALLAGVSLVSVIVGFAAQSTLGNLVAGISLVLYKPFRQGDRLQVATPTQAGFDVGTVQTVSLGFTVLRTDDGREVIIANGTMAQQTMVKLGVAGAASAKPPAPPVPPAAG